MAPVHKLRSLLLSDESTQIASSVHGAGTTSIRQFAQSCSCSSLLCIISEKGSLLLLPCCKKLLRLHCTAHMTHVPWLLHNDHRYYMHLNTVKWQPLLPASYSPRRLTQPSESVQQLPGAAAAAGPTNCCIKAS